MIQIDRALYNKKTLVIWGWVLHKEKLIDLLLVDNAGIKLCNPIIGIRRNDLSKKFPQNPNALTSGYFISLEKGLLNTDFLFLKAEFEDGRKIKKEINFRYEEKLLADLSGPLQYQIDIAKKELHLKYQQSSIADTIENFYYKPTISIIVPSYNIDKLWIDKCIASVKAQIYQKWELCIYDDGSTKKETIEALKEWINKDARIKINFGQKNCGIANATNHAIKIANGDFIAFLDHDDELHKIALFEIVKALNEYPNLDLIYSDEDKIELDGTRTGPYFKPDFDSSLILSNNYICHFLVVRKALGDGLGWFDSKFNGAQDHEFILRALTKEIKIHHIPKVLYHWRKIESSVASGMGAKNYAHDAGKLAVKSFLNHEKIKGTVSNGIWNGSYRIMRDIAGKQFVSIIIILNNLGISAIIEYVKTIINLTVYPHYELLICTEKDSSEYKEQLESISDRIKVLEFDSIANEAEVYNQASLKAREWLLFLNAFCLPRDSGWLKDLLGPAQNNQVGIVSAKILDQYFKIWHAGIVLSRSNQILYPFRNFPSDKSMHFTMNVMRQFSAVSGKCLLTKKEVFLSNDGFDQVRFPILHFDIDFCLRLRQNQYKIIYNPFCEIIISKDYKCSETFNLLEQNTMLINKWQLKKFIDPFYNVNLSQDLNNYSVRMDEILMDERQIKTK